MEFSAIQHYADKRYCFVINGKEILIRIKTKKGDIDRIILHYHDKYLPVNFIDTRKQVPMKLIVSDRYNDYFEARISVDVICLRYFFEITDTEGCCKYYGNHEFYDHIIESNDRMYDCPQNMREEEELRVPEWARNKVVYQIFTSRFATTHDVPKEEWYKAPIGAFDDLKGNLRGIINHLEHIKELGVEVIYMTPIFRSDSTHKYDTIDYFEIDPSFGTKADLKELVDKAHSMGIKIILDGVFNHSSTEFFAFKDIVEKQERSEYCSWYFIDEFPVIAKPGVKPNFLSFGYYYKMPKLNLRNPETEQYFINVGQYWIREFEIDGWRLDVGDEVTHSFWKKFRTAIRAIKTDALIIGEIWHYAGDFLEGDEWDSVMNYPFYLSVIDLVADGRIKPSEFLGNQGFLRGNLHPDCYNSLLNLIDSHDTPRFMHLCHNSSKKHRLAAALQLLSPGMPMIYYGDEYGMKGGHDPDCRRGMLWDEEYQDKKTFEHYCRLIKVRKENPCITFGEVIYDGTDDDRNLIVQTKCYENSELTLIFHSGNDSVELMEFKGRNNLLTGSKFSGVVKPYEALVLQ